MLILSGGIRLADGRSCHAGELVRSDGGTTHDFVVLKEAECIAAVVQHGGVEFRD